MSINHVLISGRLTADPQIKATNNGVLVGSFSLAVNEYVASKEKVSFINCVAFGKTTEILERYVVKGSLIGVEGSLRQDSYEDSQGNKRSSIRVIVQKIEIFEWKKGSNHSTNDQKEHPVQEEII